LGDFKFGLLLGDLKIDFRIVIGRFENRFEKLGDLKIDLKINCAEVFVGAADGIDEAGGCELDAGACTAMATVDLDPATSTVAFVESDACANSLTRAVGDLRVCIKTSPCSICTGPPHCSMGVAAAKQLAPI